MKPERISLDDILAKKYLPRLARMLGHGLPKNDSGEIEHFRKTVANFESACDDPFVLGYLRALLEVAAAYQREIGSSEEQEPLQAKVKLKGI